MEDQAGHQDVGGRVYRDAALSWFFACRDTKQRAACELDKDAQDVGRDEHCPSAYISPIFPISALSSQARSGVPIRTVRGRSSRRQSVLGKSRTMTLSVMSIAAVKRMGACPRQPFQVRHKPTQTSPARVCYGRGALTRMSSRNWAEKLPT